MFSRSLQWRIVIIIVAITFILMSVIWVFLNYRVEDIFYNEFKETISTHYATLGIRESMTFDELLHRLREDPNVLSQLIGKEKSYTILKASTEEIVYSSDLLYEEDKYHFRTELFKSKNLMKVLNHESEGKEKSITKSRDGDFYDYVIRQPLVGDDYILFFKYNRSQSVSIKQNLSTVIVSGMILAVLVTMVIGFLLSKTITKPIEDIMHKAESITSGDFGQVLAIKSDDEIGKLTRTFNYMSNQLKSMLLEISNEKNKFEMILNYMTDGIIAFSKEGEIIHINSAAIGFLKLNRQGLTFTEIMNKLGFSYTLAQLLSNHLSDNTENIKIGDRFFKIQFALVTNKDNVGENIILVLQDNTEAQKLDNMRKEFVANVSHELKTPLTSIKSYSETLLDGAVEDTDITRSFLQVIYSESNRMDRLVKDLLLLSKHDSGIKLNLQEVSPLELLQSVMERLRITADEKNQKLVMIEEDKAPVVYGDWDRLEQLLFNIIGNAIKYTPIEGAITVYLGQQDQKVCIKVVDTGIGIPEGDLERIFERFYRVDKARSRQMGGTGLGLSIAKEIAEAHGGWIRAKSEPNKGTTIMVLLPGIEPAGDELHQEYSPGNDSEQEK